MKGCQIEVIAANPGVSIYCFACHESVAWHADSFTEAEIIATAKGHRKIMAKARAAQKSHLDKQRVP